LKIENREQRLENGEQEINIRSWDFEKNISRHKIFTALI
jgi:hypothetical protein